jgi:S-adenosylmethionine-diacylglycerol 3-amino-3-carboxypropyl transferase
MAFLYDFGISQEDARTEFNALDLSPGDSVLCIASAGEIPMNLAAMADVKIVAADISVNQIRLCRLKQLTAVKSDEITGASFLGYMDMKRKTREEFFYELIDKNLNGDDSKFWKKNLCVINRGVINAGKFEIFLHTISSFLRLIAGKNNLYRLFDCTSTYEQKEIFEKKIDGPLAEGFFRLVFHPWVYTNLGIDPAGLTHFGIRNIGKFFYQRFRDFCCNTPSRTNFFLQYSLFKKILFPEALPEYLQPVFRDRFSRNGCNIEYIISPVNEVLRTKEAGTFNKIHISNISDWLSVDKMNELFRLIRDKTLPGARAVMRYVYLKHPIPLSLPDLEADYETGRILEYSDRNPFFSIVPLIRK